MEQTAFLWRDGRCHLAGWTAPRGGVAGVPGPDGRSPPVAADGIPTEDAPVRAALALIDLATLL